MCCVSYNLPKHFFVLLLLPFIFITSVLGQTDAEIVCEDNKCPEEIFEIELQEPLHPEEYTTERTERFKQAYLAFLPIKNATKQEPDWEVQYNGFLLTGISCLRYYQLESTFGNEYVKNPDFKQFVDEQGGNATTVRSGFESSRRGLNLKHRMDRNCPGELRAAEKQNGPRLADMPIEYNELGQELGYFDEEGNVLKEFDVPPVEETQTAVAPERLNKRERIEQMKQQVAQLPEAPAVQEKIAALNDDYEAAAPKIEELQQFAQGEQPTIDGLSDTQEELEEVAGDIDELADTELKFPNEELDNQREELATQSETLQNAAKQLADQEEGLQKQFDDIVQRAEAAENEAQTQQEIITNAQSRLDELAAEKARLADQLEDKPRRVIDELTTQVNDAEKEEQALNEMLAAAEGDKEKVLQELDDLTSEQQVLEEALVDTEQKAAALEEDQENLAKATKNAQDDLATAQAKEAELDKAAQALSELPSEEELNAKIQKCADELQSIYASVPQGDDSAAAPLAGQMQTLQEKYQLLQTNALEIKTVQKDIPSVNLNERTQANIAKLEERHETLDEGLGLLQDRIALLKQTVELSQGSGANKTALYEQQQADLEALSGQLGRLFRQRVRLQNAIEIGDGSIDDLITDSDALVNDFRDFQAKINCSGVDELQEALADTSTDRQALEDKIGQLEEDLNLAEGRALELLADSEKLATEAAEESAHAEEIAQEEELLQESLGEDLHLKAVKPQQWSEGFNVEREYWDAVFHPDDEIIEGYRGRYFEIRLKDSDKNVRMLFESGEYYMDRTDFRDSYGSVISAFVTEALNGLNRLEREQIRLFVQGSADMSGQNTFSGNLDGRFPYTDVTVLPYKDNSDDFKPMPVDVEIPEQGFSNNDLPNLRGNFLREMISLYSKKLEPVLLEGRVTDEVNEDDRNAIIYLFIPEELVEKYERS